MQGTRQQQEYFPLVKLDTVEKYDIDKVIATVAKDRSTSYHYAFHKAYMDHQDAGQEEQAQY